MLISLHELVAKYNIIFKGILHVGAHECEELNDYLRYTSSNKILWVEAMEDKVAMCKKKYPGINIEHAVISHTVETIKFNISNNGQSSSILEFGLHSTFHPHVTFINSIEMETKLLKDVICNHDIDYNFVNLDIQGVELRALKSMEEYLHKIDYIYTEVNSDFVYKDCNLITELDEYLKKFNFVRVETKWAGNFRWGDAFYIKMNL
jgi:FkbM family methyltransferase